MESNNTIRQYPFYIKATVVLLGLILFVFVLHVLEDILVPFAIAALFSVLLNPLNSRLEKKFPRGVAIAITVILGIIVIGSIFYFLSSEISNFSDSLPILKQKFSSLLTQLQQWLETNFGVAIPRQIQMLKDTANDNKKLVGQTLNTIMGLVGITLLIPFYVALLLNYKPLILDFLFQVFAEKNSLQVAEILAETKKAIQSYIIGLLIETAIVSAMNSAALLILGVRYAILIGVIGGLLNMLPYIGGIVAIALPVLMATVTSDGYTTQIAIVAAYTVIQIIDNNILVPRIVSSKVQINALISMIVVLLGGALWGVSGMFLSIPFIAVFKIIFDRVDGLKPWGSLLGTRIPTAHSGIQWQKRWDRILRIKEKKKAIAEAIISDDPGQPDAN